MSKQPTRDNGLTEAKALQAFLNKREAISVQILTGIARADGMQRNPAEAAAWAVDAADALLQKLYVPKDTPEKEAGEA